MRRTAPGRAHAAALESLPTAQWTTYLTEHSGLPGPRANLELVDVVGDLAPAELLREWADDADEYLAVCGTAGLGRLVERLDDADAIRLRAAADDARWRVREGVAFALQRIGDRDPTLLRETLTAWSGGGPLVLRAAAAGVCEPRLLRDRDDPRRRARRARRARRPCSSRSPRPDVGIRRHARCARGWPTAGAWPSRPTRARASRGSSAGRATRTRTCAGWSGRTSPRRA